MCDKQRQLDALTARRKTDRLKQYKTFAEFPHGIFDVHSFVSPWSISAHNVNAEVMIMGKDWAPEKCLEKEPCQFVVSLGQTPCWKTNKNLRLLLMMYLNVRFENTYATDLFTFVKPGEETDATIPPDDLDYCARTYAVPQIEAVRPRVVICNGSAPYNSLRRVQGWAQRDIGDQWDNFHIAGAAIIGVTQTGLGRLNAHEWQLIASTLGRDGNARQKEEAVRVLGDDLRHRCVHIADCKGRKTKEQRIAEIMAPFKGGDYWACVQAIVDDQELKAMDRAPVDEGRARGYIGWMVPKGYDGPTPIRGRKPRA